MGEKQPTTITEMLTAAGAYGLGEDPGADAVRAVLRRVVADSRKVDPLTAALLKSELAAVLKRAKVGQPGDVIRAAFGKGSEEEGAPDGLQGRKMELADPEPWNGPVSGAALLDETVHVLRRFLALPEGAAEGVALWVAFTHVFDAFPIAPLLNITSPEKRCGKSTLLALLEFLCRKPLATSAPSPASIFRVVEMYRPTLVLDEADAWLAENEDLRGLLNLGHRSNGCVLRTVGDEHEPRAFSVWCPKAVAGIGKRQDTISDRSVTITMRRRAPGEEVERQRMDRLMRGELEPLRRKLFTWMQGQREWLADLDPPVPPALNDRAADNWRPLLAVAHAAGGEWPARAWDTAVILAGESAEESYRVTLLRDVAGLFDARAAERIPSQELADELGRMEDRPWSEWKAGRPITARQVARILEPFGVHPKQIRFGMESKKGYDRAHFADAFARYLAEPDGAAGVDLSDLLGAA